MENLNLKKQEIFKGFDDVENRMNSDCLYEMEISGDFSNVDENEFNMDFEKELFKILPNNILTMGYRCRGCGTWITELKSLCNMCLENYSKDENQLSENLDDSTAKNWVEYYASRYKKELFLSFTTESPIDLNLIKKEFLPGKYIKEINIDKSLPCDDNVQCQTNATIYNDMYLLQYM